jgi:hypothetical protein
MSENTGSVTSSGQIDLNELVRGYSLTLATSENEEDRKSRLQKEIDDAVHERRKDSVLFLVSLASVSGTLLFCFWAISKGLPFPEHSSWMTIVASIVGAFAGYLVGKSKKKSDS